MVNEVKTPKVMLVTHALSAGGAERIVTDLATQLPAHGFDVEVVAVLGGGMFKNELRKAGVPVTVLRRHGFAGIGTLRDLYRHFQKTKPDVVHTHLFLADTWGRIAALFARVPVRIVTEHNINTEYRWYHHMVNRILLPITSMFVAVSKDVAQDLKRYHVATQKITTIRNGIDLSRFRARGARDFHQPPRLISVARFFPQKGHQLLFEALADVKEPWRLQLVGEGPLEKELRKSAENLKIASRIEWLGARSDVPKLLAGADLFCFPSQWEGLGLAAIEAASVGVPVIASDLPALREVFSDDDVMFVTRDSASAWAKAISRALKKPKAPLRRASHAVATVHATMGLERMVSAHADLYRKVLGDRY